MHHTAPTSLCLPLPFFFLIKSLTSYNAIGKNIFEKCDFFFKHKIITCKMLGGPGGETRKTLTIFDRFSSLSTISHPTQLCFYCTQKAKNCVEIPKLVQSRKQEVALQYRGLAENNEKPQRGKGASHTRGKTNVTLKNK